MKIKSLYNFDRKFNIVSLGEVFSCADEPNEYFMKILSIVTDNNHCYNAVDLKTGTPVYVNDEDRVYIYKDVELEIKG